MYLYDQSPNNRDWIWRIMIIVSFRHVIVKFFLTSLRSFSKWQVESFDTATRATKAQFCAKHNASPKIENHCNRARVCGASATGRTQDHGAKFRIKSVGIISECDTLCRDGAVSAIDTRQWRTLRKR